MSSSHLLTACLRRGASTDGRDFDRLSEHAWRALLAQAARHRVRPLLFRTLSAPAFASVVPTPVIDGLRADCGRIGRRNLHMHAELVRVASAFRAASIPLMVLKGAHLGVAVYRNVALREMGDLDILVPRDRLEDGLRALEGLGFSTGTPCSIERDVAISHHVSPVSNSKVTIELHWNITEPGYPYSTDPDELWRRSVSLHSSRLDVSALSREDLLLHLCVHVGFQHRCELVLHSLCDIAELLGDEDAVDWDDVVRQTRRRKWTPAVQLVLRLARDMLGAVVPAAAADALGVDTLPPAVARAGRDQLLWVTDVKASPTRRLSSVGAQRGWRAKSRVIIGAVFLPDEELRREYPDAARSRRARAFAYGRRLAHVLRRHTPMAARLWFARDHAVVQAAARQQDLRAHLFSNTLQDAGKW